MAGNAKDKDLISRVQASAQKLRIAAIWSHGLSLKVADSFLLELYLLFMIIEDSLLRYTNNQNYNSFIRLRLIVVYHKKMYSEVFIEHPTPSWSLV